MVWKECNYVTREEKKAIYLQCFAKQSMNTQEPWRKKHTVWFSLLILKLISILEIFFRSSPMENVVDLPSLL